jgi:Type II secretion system (T2SS), protein M subtype b
MNVPAYLLGRRAALSAAALLCLVIVLALAGAAWLLLYSGEPSSDEAIRQLALLRAEARALPKMRAAAAALRAEAQAQPGLLQGESDTLAQVALQNDLKSLVEANGGEVRSAYALPATAENGLSRISVQYDLTLPVNKLRSLAYAIEARTPYLFLSAIDVAAPRSWPTAAEIKDHTIEVRWTVTGYRARTKP